MGVVDSALCNSHFSKNVDKKGKELGLKTDDMDTEYYEWLKQLRNIIVLACLTKLNIIYSKGVYTYYLHIGFLIN